jgi:hypothetical protein
MASLAAFSDAPGSASCASSGLPHPMNQAMTNTVVAYRLIEPPEDWRDRLASI